MRFWKCFKQCINTHYLLLNVLKFIAYCLLILSFIAIMLTLFNKCFSCVFNFSANGISFFIEQFNPFKSLFYGTILTTTLAVALDTFVHAKQVDETNGLQNLRKLLTSSDNMKIHEMLEWETEEEKAEKEKKFHTYFKDNKCKVFNYLGILELSEIYLRNNVISESLFLEQFGYRIDNVFSNAFLKSEIDKYRKCWNTLYDLYSRVIQMTNKKNKI